MDVEHGGAWILIRGAEGSPRIPIGAAPSLLGRDPWADIFVEDRKVSRHHLLMWWRADRLWVRDLGSRIGTRVGSQVLGSGEAGEVQPGSSIFIAGCLLMRWEPREAGPVDERRWLVRREADGHWTVGEGKPRRPPADLEGGGAAHSSQDPDATSAPAEFEAAVASLRRNLGGAYRLVAGQAGGGVAVETPHDDARVPIHGEGAATLLLTLAQRRLAHRAGWTADAWVDDAELARTLWGAVTGGDQVGRIPSLIRAVRAQLTERGIPGDFVDRQTTATRLGASCAAVVVAGD